MRENKKLFLLIHNIRSVQNVASIFRIAECAGVDKVFLSGFSPCPLDRFNRERKDFNKISLGAEKSVVWEYNQDYKEIIENLKKESKNLKQELEIVALEQHEKAIKYKDYKKTKNTLLILGTERTGIDSKVLQICDKIIEIPQAQKSQKESLNVAIASAIAIFHTQDL